VKIGEPVRRSKNIDVFEIDFNDLSGEAPILDLIRTHIGTKPEAVSPSAIIEVLLSLGFLL